MASNSFTVPIRSRLVPPALPAGHDYVSVYENRYGEPWIFSAQRSTGEAHLSSSDTDFRPAVLSADEPFPTRLMLTDEERVWLRACWMAVLRESDDAIKRRVQAQIQRIVQANPELESALATL